MGPANHLAGVHAKPSSSPIGTQPPFSFIRHFIVPETSPHAVNIFNVIIHTVFQIYISFLDMQILQDSWRAKAKAKVADMKSKIPDDWTLKQADLEMAKKQRKLNGVFFENFLSGSDLDIIRNDSVQLVDKIKAKRHTAVEVTQAYCKAAAIAQQIVSKAEQTRFQSTSHFQRVIWYTEPANVE